MLLLQLSLEVDQRCHAALCVLADPAVVDQPDRDRVEEVVLLPPRALRDDKTCFLEDAQVLHHAKPRHLQLGLQLRERAAVTRKEQVEQEATGRVGEGLEHPVVIHATQNT